MELNITEIPTTLRKDPPGRKPHLKTWRDGWRHLKFMLSFAPRIQPSTISLFLLTSVALSPLPSANCALQNPQYIGLLIEHGAFCKYHVNFILT